MEDVTKYTKAEFGTLISKIRKQCEPKDGYSYFMPSPNQGKKYYIHGWIYPEQVADMVVAVWEGKKTVDEIPEMEEIDIPMFEVFEGGYCE